MKRIISIGQAYDADLTKLLDLYFSLQGYYATDSKHQHYADSFVYDLLKTKIRYDFHNQKYDNNIKTY